MFGLIAGIITLIAAGIFIVKVIKMTMAWLKSKIDKAFTNKNVGKVLVQIYLRLLMSVRIKNLGMN